MESVVMIWATVGLILGLINGCLGCCHANLRSCKFPAIYNFGDSNSDTGGRSASLLEAIPPNGETFFGEPAGRYSDGRLIIDFLAEAMNLPFLNAYLDSIPMNFRHGANFATGGSSILTEGYSPFHLKIQIAQFMQFKKRTSALYHRLEKKKSSIRRRLPQPDEFSRALYTIDIGQNDLSYRLSRESFEEIKKSISRMVQMISQSIYQLYWEGARVFRVHNTGPYGCLPYNVKHLNLSAKNLDQSGCVRYLNKVAQEFNEQLKDTVYQLSKNLSNTSITYVDVYSAKYKVFSNPKQYGFGDPFEFCCGRFNGSRLVDCGVEEVIQGKTYDNLCKDPSKVISWDSVHYTQAANEFVAELIINGSLSDPPIARTC